jgi:protein SCO1/2
VKPEEPTAATEPVVEEVKQDTEEPKARSELPFVIAGGVFGYIFYKYFHQEPKQSDIPVVKVVGEPLIGGAWTAMNSQGREVTDTDYHGKFLVLYFGFTKCPDVCPSTLTKLAASIKLLQDQGLHNKAAFLFVSLDPERDLPATVGDYAYAFSPDIQGIVVPQDKVQSFTKTFRLYRNKVPTEDGGYNIDHTTYMYLMDPEGKLASVLGAHLSSDELAEAVAAQLR